MPVALQGRVDRCVAGPGCRGLVLLHGGALRQPAWDVTQRLLVVRSVPLFVSLRLVRLELLDPRTQLAELLLQLRVIRLWGIRRLLLARLLRLVCGRRLLCGRGLGPRLPAP